MGGWELGVGVGGQSAINIPVEAVGVGGELMRTEII